MLVAFTALNLYQMLAGPLKIIPLVINEAITVYVSCERIQKFFAVSKCSFAPAYMR